MPFNQRNRTKSPLKLHLFLSISPPLSSPSPITSFSPSPLSSLFLLHRSFFSLSFYLSFASLSLPLFFLSPLFLFPTVYFYLFINFLVYLLLNLFPILDSLFLSLCLSLYFSSLLDSLFLSLCLSLYFSSLLDSLFLSLCLSLYFSSLLDSLFLSLCLSLYFPPSYLSLLHLLIFYFNKVSFITLHLSPATIFFFIPLPSLSPKHFGFFRQLDHRMFYGFLIHSNSLFFYVLKALAVFGSVHMNSLFCAPQLTVLVFEI